MKKVFISIDVEPDLHTDNYTSVEALSKLLPLFQKYGVKATFFVTCDCLEKNPGIFLELKKQGHEIALHGLQHKRFDILSLQEKQTNISKSLSCFKKHLKIRPVGFRGPQHAIDSQTIHILKKNKFKYDSSLTPWNFYHIIFFWKMRMKFLHNLAPLKVHKRNGLLEVPIISLVFPFSSVTLRILPKPLLKLHFHLISLFKNPIFLMHSWDLIEVSGSKLYKVCPLPSFIERLEYMLNFFHKKRNFSTIKNLN